MTDETTLKDEEDQRQRLLVLLEGDLSYTQTLLDKFEQRFKQNPLIAFEWSDEAFKAAARRHVAKYLYKSLVNGESLQKLQAELLRLSLEGSVKTPTPSFSARSVLIMSDRIAAYTHYLYVMNTV